MANFLKGQGGDVRIDGVSKDIADWNVKYKGETKKSRRPSMGNYSSKTAVGLEIEGDFEYDMMDSDPYPEPLKKVTIHFRMADGKQYGGDAIIRDVEVGNKNNDVVHLKVMVENDGAWGLIPT